MSITVSLYVENQVLYVNLNGELDHHTSDQLRSRLAMEAHRTVEDRYCIDKVANLYIDLYNTLVG